MFCTSYNDLELTLFSLFSHSLPLLTIAANVHLPNPLFIFILPGHISSLCFPAFLAITWLSSGQQREGGSDVSSRPSPLTASSTILHNEWRGFWIIPRTEPCCERNLSLQGPGGDLTRRII